MTNMQNMHVALAQRAERRDEHCSSGIRNECNLPKANLTYHFAATERGCASADAQCASLHPFRNAVGTSIARPAFGTNAICRRQI